ncbi:MAG: hypothetical protein CMI16_02685 [Opitutaceae bacterium]|nr:hypothetical protein [Opitutaceae bacterium]
MQTTSGTNPLILMGRNLISSIVPECTICCGRMICDHAITKCGHIYCPLCISKWGAIKGTCPECRTPFNPQRDLCRIPQLATAGEAWRQAGISSVELTDTDRDMMSVTTKLYARMEAVHAHQVEELKASKAQLYTQLEAARAQVKELETSKAQIDTKAMEDRRDMAQKMHLIADSLKRSMNELKKHSNSVQSEVDNCCVWLNRCGGELPPLRYSTKRKRIIVDELEKMQMCKTTTTQPLPVVEVPEDSDNEWVTTSPSYSPTSPGYSPTSQRDTEVELSFAETAAFNSVQATQRPRGRSSTSPIYQPPDLSDSDIARMNAQEAAFLAAQRDRAGSV